MSRHFALTSELTGAIAKRLPHAKNQLSVPGSFFNQFVTYIYTVENGFFDTPFARKNVKKNDCQKNPVLHIPQRRKYILEVIVRIIKYVKVNFLTP